MTAGPSGHSLVATARGPAQQADLAERYGDRVRTVALDVTDEAAAVAAVATPVDAFGRLDVVVNNAGYANAMRDNMMGKAARTESDAKWRELSLSTDYDDLTDENVDP